MNALAILGIIIGAWLGISNVPGQGGGHRMPTLAFKVEYRWLGMVIGSIVFFACLGFIFFA